MTLAEFLDGCANEMDNEERPILRSTLEDVESKTHLVMTSLVNQVKEKREKTACKRYSPYTMNNNHNPAASNSTNSCSSSSNSCNSTTTGGKLKSPASPEAPEKHGKGNLTLRLIHIIDPKS